jgi:hypothetical protein
VMYYGRRGSLLLGSASVISSLCLIAASYLYQKEITPWDFRVPFMILHLPGHMVLNNLKNLVAHGFFNGGHISTFFVFFSNAIIYAFFGWLVGSVLDMRRRQGREKPMIGGTHH